MMGGSKIAGWRVGARAAGVQAAGWGRDRGWGARLRAGVSERELRACEQPGGGEIMGGSKIAGWRVGARAAGVQAAGWGRDHGWGRDDGWEQDCGLACRSEGCGRASCRVGTRSWVGARLRAGVSERELRVCKQPGGGEIVGARCGWEQDCGLACRSEGCGRASCRVGTRSWVGARLRAGVSERELRACKLPGGGEIMGGSKIAGWRVGARLSAHSFLFAQ